MIKFYMSTITKLRSKRNLITISDKAAERITELMKQQNNPAFDAVKIGVRKRGCNGLSYTMNYCSGPDKLDEVVEAKGCVKVIVDSKAVMVLVGTEMDYVEDDIKSEFVFKNPNQKGQCGCGESFHI
ncbi:unnamed protein product (macronuclear) [Paramecium tetraurelia]|uniref:Core domain-containing protein n=1 Tax=Paramecium tetraurelia TaxID=5888 RepID=A0DFI2_PARTE|nr:uncharacterized protein GSPATT00016612001 [Paramecium tetraurelia]CAK81799.1 unnamed protein product [Paramecium tetraurelia]|eukprot:XP_001449196.1 hypothetical protein (macronuclear) [Paramecium tetraurelia strain d4-2]